MDLTSETRAPPYTPLHLPPPVCPQEPPTKHRLLVPLNIQALNSSDNLLRPQTPRSAMRCLTPAVSGLAAPCAPSSKRSERRTDERRSSGLADMAPGAAVLQKLRFD